MVCVCVCVAGSTRGVSIVLGTDVSVRTRTGSPWLVRAGNSDCEPMRRLSGRPASRHAFPWKREREKGAREDRTARMRVDEEEGTRVRYRCETYIVGTSAVDHRPATKYQKPDGEFEEAVISPCAAGGAGG